MKFRKLLRSFLSINVIKLFHIKNDGEILATPQLMFHLFQLTYSKIDPYITACFSEASRALVYVNSAESTIVYNPTTASHNTGGFIVGDSLHCYS
jgi:hypothetical protein